MVLAVMDGFDSSERPVFDAAWQACGRVNGLAARGVVISSKIPAGKAGIFMQDAVYSPSNDPADRSVDIQAKISAAERKERGIPKV